MSSPAWRLATDPPGQLGWLGACWKNIVGDWCQQGDVMYQTLGKTLYIVTVKLNWLARPIRSPYIACLLKLLTLVILLWYVHWPAQANWNHWLPENAPQPQLPEVLDVTVLEGTRSLSINMPFHWTKNVYHHNRSEWNHLFSLMKRSGLAACDRQSIMRRSNIRPGHTTIAAWLKWPKRDWSWCLLHKQHPTHPPMTDCNLSHLTSLFCSNLNCWRYQSWSLGRPM